MPAEKWVDKEVVTDNGLVTSRKPGGIPAFNREMISLFAAGTSGTRKPQQKIACTRDGANQETARTKIAPPRTTRSTRQPPVRRTPGRSVSPTMQPSKTANYYRSVSTWPVPSQYYRHLPRSAKRAQTGIVGRVRELERRPKEHFNVPVSY